ncbi:MAG: hypothetical protein ABSF38_03100 [Verrucomicrobiota bacterium]
MITLQANEGVQDCLKTIKYRNSDSRLAIDSLRCESSDLDGVLALLGKNAAKAAIATTIYPGKCQGMSGSQKCANASLKATLVCSTVADALVQGTQLCPLFSGWLQCQIPLNPT